jgi:hypothetical protein
MDRWSWPRGFKFAGFCSSLMDGPSRRHGQSMRIWVRPVCCLFVRVHGSIRRSARFLSEEVWWTVREQGSNGPCRSDGPMWHVGQSVYVGCVLVVLLVEYGRSVPHSRTVCPSFTNGLPVSMDGPRPPYGQSVLVWQIRLCPLLLDLCLHFATWLDLFLGSVGLLWLRDLGEIVWEPLRVILGLGWFSLGEFFIDSHSLPPL